MNNKRFLLTAIFSVLIATFALSMVSAANEDVTVIPHGIQSGVAQWGNYTTNITFNITYNYSICGLNNVSNVTIWYNTSAGGELKNLTTWFSDSQNQTAWYNTTSIFNLSSLKYGYSFVVSFCNKTNSNTKNCNVTNLNVTGTVPGSARNKSVSGAVIINVTIDNNAPVFGINSSSTMDTNFSSPAQWTNYSTASLRNSTIFVNVSINASISGIAYAIVNVSRNQTQIANYTLVNEGANAYGTSFWSVSISPTSTTFPDGLYQYNLSVRAYTLALNESGQYGALGIVNNSVNIKDYSLNHLTIDNTAPVLSFSCTATVEQYDTETCTCSGTDATTSMNLSYGSSGYSFTAHPSTALSGPQTVTCSAKDMVDNTVSAEYTYRVSGEVSNTGGSSSGGSSSSGTTGTTPAVTWVTSATLSSSEASAGTSESVAVNERVQVQASATESYFVGVSAITETAATVAIVGTTDSKTLAVGEIAKFDTNADGFYDLSATLGAISGGKADLTLQTIYEEIAPVDLEEQTEASTTGISSTTGWIIAGIAIIIIAIVAYLLYKRKQYY